MLKIKKIIISLILSGVNELNLKILKYYFFFILLQAVLGMTSFASYASYI